MTGHLGYDKHDPAGRGSGNNRNGSTPKTVLTDIGAVDLAVPRDRNEQGDDPSGTGGQFVAQAQAWFDSMSATVSRSHP